jgi:hypothetical protein
MKVAVSLEVLYLSLEILYSSLAYLLQVWSGNRSSGYSPLTRVWLS